MDASTSLRDPAAAHLPQEDEVLDNLFAASMPKEEIGALRFLKEYPQYDGRGVVIAIFDTGVCPGAAGLAVTTDGKPKILDIVDCTGSGDVDTSSVVKADAEGYLTAVSGARLRVNSGWSNPTGDWHVGCVHAYRLFPDPLVSRIKRERRRQWDEQHRLSLTAVATDLAAWDRASLAGLKSGPEGAKEKAELEARQVYLKEAAKQYEDHGPLIDCVVWHDGSCWRSALDTRELQESALGSGRAGDGGDGSLESFQPMTDYKAERRHGVFSYLDSCSYVLNTYDNGNTLSIVVDCGAHGTHVAGITAAHFPEDPSMNGIAPGAQIISCKIGDTRLGATETGTALTRALITVLEHKCKLINMSFGEPTCTPNKGRFVELANELVHKHGVVFVASAGNNGPALSTVSAPGGTCSAIFGVGAYVSPGLAEAGHSVQADGAGRQYTWCSRGPAADGYVGVAFSAPGGAISPVPTWTLQKRQLMNGTSMAAPNASGGIALILSGLMQRQERRHSPSAPSSPTSALALASTSASVSASSPPSAAASGLPVRLRRALDATCLPLGADSPDAILTYGRGLIQVDATFEYLLRAENVDAMPIRYDVTVSPSGGAPPGLSATRGVYLRQGAESCRPASFSVLVTPVLPDLAPNEARLAVEDRIVLEVTNLRSTTNSVATGGSSSMGAVLGVVCDAGEGGKAGGWVSCPSSLLLHHSGRSFDVRVDGSGLEYGLHYAEVCGYDSTARWRGPLFHVPITVIRPLPLPPAPPPPAFTPPNLSLGPLDFGPGTEHRLFLDVPAGATWAEVVFRAGPHDCPRVFALRATQLQQQLSYKRCETGMSLTLSGRSEYVWSVSVVPSSTLELTLAQQWSCMGASSLSVEVCFHGLLLEGASGAAGANGASDWTGVGVMLDGSAGVKRMVVQAPLRNEKLRPEARLTAVQWGLRPHEYRIEPLANPRDTLPEGRVVSRLLLTYKLNVAEAGWFTLRTPVIGQHVYDALIESQTMMIFDQNKKLLQTSDVFPESVNLKKGDYTVRVMLRHDNPEVLDKMSALPVHVSRKLDSSITIPIYSSQRDAISSTSNLTSEYLLKAGAAVPLFLGPLPDDRLPKDALQGRTLVGTVQLGATQKSGNNTPTTLPLTYLVPAPKQPNGNGVNGSGAASGAATPTASGAAGEGTETAAEKALREALRDAKIKFLQDIKLGITGPEGDQYRQLYYSLLRELKEANPGHLPLLQQHLKKLDVLDGDGSGGVSGLRGIVAAADEVIAAIDQKDIMYTLAVKCPEETPEAKKARSEAEQRRSVLIDALHRKCQALMELWEREDRDREAREKEAQTAAAAAAAAAKAAELTDIAVNGHGSSSVVMGNGSGSPNGKGGDVGVSVAAAATVGADLVVVLGAGEDGSGVDGAPMRVVDVLSDGEEQEAEEELLVGAVGARPMVVASVSAPAPEAAPVIITATAAAAVAAPIVTAPAAALGTAVSSAPAVVTDTAKEFQAAFAELRKWVDTATSPDYAFTHARAEARAKRYASALQALDKGLADDYLKGWHRDMQTLKQRLLQQLGWAHLDKSERAAQQVKFPKNFQPF